MATTEKIPLKHFGRVFEQMNRNARSVSYRRVIDGLQPKLRKRQRSIFASESSPAGVPWPALAESTFRRKRAKGGSRKILVASGRLRASLTSPNHPDNVTRMRTVGKKTVLFWGTKVPYSIFHTLGTSRMPRREHVTNIDDKLFDEMISDVSKLLIAALKKRG